MAGSPVLRPISTMANHSTECSHSYKGHNICGVQSEKIGGFSLGFTEQIVSSYFFLTLAVGLPVQGISKKA